MTPAGCGIIFSKPFPKLQYQKINLCIYRAFPDVGINIDIKNCDPRLVAAVDQLIRKFGREDRENTDETFWKPCL